MARKILLADDSVTAQNMGRKILADAGYEVITVNNGSAALKKINEQHPDVIVLDVYMPGYSGLEVCQRLKEVGETSRIPILLTVGKLEPFKPEEARRVRADGFIVKPFEASELLSALTKLEDKIVPHSESTKSGRFGRAAVALDDPRFDRTVAIEEDDGWKTRLRFPPKKKEKAEDDAASAAPPAKKEEPVVAQAPAAPHSEKKTTDDKVDLAALAPAGLPKDVTPEEIAALAAAAARMKGKFADDKVPSEKPVATSASTDEAKAETPAAAESVATTKSMAGPGPIYAPEQKVEKNEPEAKPDEIKKESPSVEAASIEAPAVEAKSPAEEKPAGAKSEEAKPEEKPAEVPVIAPAAVLPPASSESAPEPPTTAVAPVAESAPPRWTAVAVALAPEDSALSLEQEMQKAFAASAGAESSQTVPVSTLPANETISETPASGSEPLPAQTLSASVAADPELSSSAACSAAAELVTAAVNELETMASSYAAQAPARSESDVATSSESPASTAPETGTSAAEAQASGPAPEVSSEAPKSESPEPEKIKPATSAEPVVAVSRASEEAAAKTEPVSLSPSPEVVSENSPATAEASLQSEARAPESSVHPPTDFRRHEPDPADSTAAAWATWKRVKDSGEETPEPVAASLSPKHEDFPPQDTAAMAAAVGANSPVDEVKPDAESDPDVASIVDSVLANLRPKIVQEISRKLGKK